MSYSWWVTLYHGVIYSLCTMYVHIFNGNKSILLEMSKNGPQNPMRHILLYCITVHCVLQCVIYDSSLICMNPIEWWMRFAELARVLKPLISCSIPQLPTSLGRTHMAASSVPRKRKSDSKIPDVTSIHGFKILTLNIFGVYMLLVRFSDWWLSDPLILSFLLWLLSNTLCLAASVETCSHTFGARNFGLLQNFLVRMCHSLTPHVWGGSL